MHLHFVFYQILQEFIYIIQQAVLVALAKIHHTTVDYILGLADKR